MWIRDVCRRRHAALSRPWTSNSDQASTLVWGRRVRGPGGRVRKMRVTAWPVRHTIAIGFISRRCVEHMYVHALDAVRGSWQRPNRNALTDPNDRLGLN
eukprot:1208773-Amorphochlora_amoeboformis.AAC.1